MPTMVVLAGLPGLLTDVLDEQLRHHPDLTTFVIGRKTTGQLPPGNHNAVVVLGAWRALERATSILRGRPRVTALIVIEDACRTIHTYELRSCEHDVSVDELIGVLKDVACRTDRTREDGCRASPRNS